mgnify:CR=1 FL=1
MISIYAENNYIKVENKIGRFLRIAIQIRKRSRLYVIFDIDVTLSVYCLSTTMTNL